MTAGVLDPGPPVEYAWAGEFLERYVLARTRFEVDAFMDLFSRDAVLQPDPFGPPLAGGNAIRAYLLQCSIEESDIELTMERHWVSGHTILAAWHASFVRRQGSRHVREAGFLTAEIRDRRVERLRVWTVTKREGA